MSQNQYEVDCVNIDELVIMQIIKHAMSSSEKQTIGQLHGLYSIEKSELEIANCYPLPVSQDVDEDMQYDVEMTKKLDEIQFDNNKIGWYQVSYKNDNLVDFDAFDIQKGYQKKIPCAIYLVYEILEAKKGNSMPFRAYRLNQNFIELSNEQTINPEETKKYTTKYDKIFREVKVNITKSPLTQCFISEYQNQLYKKFANEDTYNTSKLLEQNTSYLNEAVDDMLYQTGKLNDAYLNKTQRTITKVPKDIESSDFIDSLLAIDRVNKLAGNINHSGKFLQESSDLLSKLNVQK